VLGYSDCYVTKSQLNQKFYVGDCKCYKFLLLLLLLLLLFALLFQILSVLNFLDIILKLYSVFIFPVINLYVVTKFYRWVYDVSL